MAAKKIRLGKYSIKVDYLGSGSYWFLIFNKMDVAGRSLKISDSIESCSFEVNSNTFYRAI